MRGVIFDAALPKYISTLALGKVNKALYYGGMSCTTYKEKISEPKLVNEEWVKIKTLYGGICGSDLNLVYLHDSPSASPFASFPFVVGHENVGEIVEVGSKVTGFSIGDRVIADPMLSCKQRGFKDLCPSCQRGDNSVCENFAEGELAPGMLIGSCKDTGGSWGEYYVAHLTQLIKVPEHVKSEDAVLVDPLASAVHPVMRNFPKDTDRVLIVGAGIIGLMCVAVLRAMGSKCSITVIARYRFQEELAKKYGADHVIDGRGDYYSQLAAICGGRLYKPIIGKRVMSGGFNTIYDCVGSSTTIDDSLRLTKSGGKMVLVGLASFPKNVDWTPIWLKEVTVAGGYCYSTEHVNGEEISSYSLALKLIAEGKVDVSGLLTHVFDIKDYKKALQVASGKGANKSIKVAFKF